MLRLSPIPLARTTRRYAVGVLAICAAFVLASCGRKESKTNAQIQAAANPINPTETTDAQEKARVAQAVAMRSGVAPAAPTMTLRGGEPATPEVLAAYNQQLAQLIFQRRDAPETLQELVTKWPMPRLPVAPPGKQIIYDPRSRIILLNPP